ncbi:hypothetical protein J4E05_17575 [Thalassospira sp. NFXS8]|uniref:hypothetical protein n=1 Tax=Thalassospira sp. NFXS8 TaxID=2819093 RepID=UPI0032DE971C
MSLAPGRGKRIGKKKRPMRFACKKGNVATDVVIRRTRHWIQYKGLAFWPGQQAALPAHSSFSIQVACQNADFDEISNKCMMQKETLSIRNRPQPEAKLINDDKINSNALMCIKNTQNYRRVEWIDEGTGACCM